MEGINHVATQNRGQHDSNGSTLRNLLLKLLGLDFSTRFAIASGAPMYPAVILSLPKALATPLRLLFSNIPGLILLQKFREVDVFRGFDERRRFAGRSGKDYMGRTTSFVVVMAASNCAA
jgi:hypothetical protein